MKAEVLALANTPQSCGKPHARNRPGRSGAGGFALVLSLVLLAFLVLTFVVLAAVLQTTAASTSQKSALALARQNALAGVNLALAELQALAGPDQRATATADLFEEHHPDHGKIVGVWNTDPGSPDYGKRLGWLASGEPDPTNVVPDSWPILASARGPVPAVRAKAESFMVDGRESGRFAWWIADEGVKASVALEPSTRQVGDPRRWRSAHRFGLELMDGFAAVSDPGNWPRVNAREQIGFLGDDTLAGVAKAKFHDFTIRAEGVLANVKSGGLKKDLTAGLQPNAPNPPGNTPIFPPQRGGNATTDPGGPRWSQLRSFHNTRVTGNTGAGSIALRSGNNDTVTIAPVLTHVQVYGHALPIDEEGTQFRFYIMPGFGLWNPYQHALQSPGFWITYRAGSSAWRWSVRSSQTAPNSAAFDVPRSLSWFVPETTWQPGEIKFFSLDQQRPLPQPWSTASATAGIANLTLAEGWFDGFGNYVDRPADPPLPGGFWMETTNPGGNSSVFFATQPNRTGPTHTGVFARVEGLQANVNTPPQVTTSHGLTEVTATTAGPAPTDDTRLDAANPGTTFPAFGWRAVMKFARMTELPMTFAPGRNSAPPAPFETLYLGHYNPRAVHSHFPEDQRARFPYWANPSYAAEFRRGRANEAVREYADTGSFAAGFSGSLDSSDVAAYFEFLRPDEPVLGIGRLMQAGLSRTGGAQGFDNYLPAFAIGNSLADPRVPPDRTHRSWEGFGSATGTHYDYSYLLNTALWDEFFFSAIPRAGALDLSAPLDHPRLSVLGEPAAENLRGYDTAARHLLVTGVFNVNSTSVEAWKALLASFWGEDIETVPGPVSGAGFSSYPRYTEPVGGAWTNMDNEFAETTHTGFRRLSQAQIAALATEIVNALRERAKRMGHPFLSLADFVNRALLPAGADPDGHRLKGLLQQAIDATDINAPLRAPGLQLNVDAFQTQFEIRQGAPTGLIAAQVNGDLLFGVPGYLTQADLLARLGDVLAVRSDTFLIRAYGESLSPGDQSVLARAWCEMEVQRLPRGLGRNPGDPDEFEPDPQRGRAFVVTGFRWLREEDL
jgi:hypothetical protein